MASVIRGDIRNFTRDLAQNPRKFDRIIFDAPSFLNRWGAAEGLGNIRDITSAVCHIADNYMSDGGTFTYSGTGVAREKFNEWVAAKEGEWEEVPDSEWAMFRPTVHIEETGKQYWHRRDDWTHVTTMRKVGSDFTIRKDRWPEVRNYTKAFANYPWPSSMGDVAMSAFRSPVHVGINEAKEYQKWLLKNNIEFREYTRDDGVEMVDPTSVAHPAKLTGGYIVQFADAVDNPSNSIHIPKRIVSFQDVNNAEGKVSLSDADKLKFYDATRKGMGVMSEAGHHRHFMLSMWLMATHTDKNDRVLVPCCGVGGNMLAGMMLGRSMTGVERNPGRVEVCKQALNDYAD